MDTSFNAGQAIQAVSVSTTRQFGAIAIGSYVQVVRIDGDELLGHCSLESDSSGRSTFTTSDVAWNSFHPERLAASATNGSVVVFNVDYTSSGTANKSSKTWTSVDEASRAVHKVSWHPQEHNVLASACQDGTVKIFDVRQEALAQTFSSRADATRDVQFDPYHSYIVAAVFENGSLCLWDRRKTPSDDKEKGHTAWLKIAAHTNSSLAIAFCPTVEWLLATGSRDRTVKVWDFSVSAADEETFRMNSPHPQSSASNQFGANNNNSMQVSTVGAAPQKPLYVLHTPTAVGRIAWRPSSLNDTRQERQQLQLATSSPDRGEISVWAVNMSNIPVCILKGHSNEACTGISWIDTPTSSSSSSSSSTISPPSTSMNSSKKTNTKGTTISRADNALLSSTFSASSTTSKGCSGEWLDVHQHILSSGKDGRLLVQDLRNGLFPRQHIARAMATISSNGHVAYQRGSVSRSDQIGLTVNNLTAAAPRLYADDSSKFGMPFGSQKLIKEEIENANAATGHVYVGLADISGLENAADIRQIRGAEAGVFDPALMKILAKKYSLGEAGTGTGSGTMDEFSIPDSNSGDNESDVARACRINLAVATQAGLKCRSAVWSTVLTLIPKNVSTVNNSFCSSSSVKTVQTPGGANSIQNSVPHGTVIDREQSVSVSISNNANINNNNNNNNGDNADKINNWNQEEQVPFASELLGDILLELLEGGDCQHFTVLCEILRRAGLLQAATLSAGISKARQREAYLAYLEILNKLQLFCSANSIISVSDEEYISKMNLLGVSIHTACSRCGMELPERVSSPWCSRCKRCAGLCSVCRRPVRGLLHWCPVCGHGGHLSCHKLWFSQNSTCPSGCGHDCCSSMNLSEGGSGAGAG